MSNEIAYGKPYWQNFNLQNITAEDYLYPQFGFNMPGGDLPGGGGSAELFQFPVKEVEHPLTPELVEWYNENTAPFSQPFFSDDMGENLEALLALSSVAVPYMQGVPRILQQGARYTPYLLDLIKNYGTTAAPAIPAAGATGATAAALAPYAGALGVGGGLGYLLEGTDVGELVEDYVTGRYEEGDIFLEPILDNLLFGSANLIGAGDLGYPLPLSIDEWGNFIDDPYAYVAEARKWVPKITVDGEVINPGGWVEEGDAGTEGLKDKVRDEIDEEKKKKQAELEEEVELLKDLNPDAEIGIEGDNITYKAPEEGPKDDEDPEEKDDRTFKEKYREAWANLPRGVRFALASEGINTAEKLFAGTDSWANPIDALGRTIFAVMKGTGAFDEDMEYSGLNISYDVLKSIVDAIPVLEMNTVFGKNQFGEWVLNPDISNAMGVVGEVIVDVKDEIVDDFTGGDSNDTSTYYDPNAIDPAQKRKQEFQALFPATDDAYLNSLDLEGLENLYGVYQLNPSDPEFEQSILNEIFSKGVSVDSLYKHFDEKELDIPQGYPIEGFYKGGYVKGYQEGGYIDNELPGNTALSGLMQNEPIPDYMDPYTPGQGGFYPNPPNTLTEFIPEEGPVGQYQVDPYAPTGGGVTSPMQSIPWWLDSKNFMGSAPEVSEIEEDPAYVGDAGKPWGAAGGGYVPLNGLLK